MFAARVAVFQGTPVVLVAPLDKKSWIADRLEHFGEGPYVFESLAASGKERGDNVAKIAVGRIEDLLGSIAGRSAGTWASSSRLLKRFLPSASNRPLAGRASEARSGTRGYSN